MCLGKVKEVMDQRIEFVVRAVSKDQNSERVVPSVRDKPDDRTSLDKEVSGRREL